MGVALLWTFATSNSFRGSIAGLIEFDEESLGLVVVWTNHRVVYGALPTWILDVHFALLSYSANPHPKTSPMPTGGSTPLPARRDGPRPLRGDTMVFDYYRSPHTTSPQFYTPMPTQPETTNTLLLVIADPGSNTASSQTKRSMSKHAL
ncbi:hypothetical protein K449DRAFT_430606 [Hypoxylon sp. EC38]|nr:hypothetical protein K449DRAFT_430606 [Hypoxylon sp. EC38]